MLHTDLVRMFNSMSECMTIKHVIQICLDDYNALTENTTFKQIIYNDENLQYEETIDNIIIKIIKINNINYYFYLIAKKVY